VAEALGAVVSRSDYEAVLEGEARAVDLTAIEHELTQLWMAAATDSDHDTPVARASALSLVVYTSDEQAARRLGEVITHASGSHPNRSIVVIGDPEAADAGPEAAISAHCQIAPHGGKQVCSEQVILRASGPTLAELHGTVTPLLVSDMPVFLWWHALPDPGIHLFGELLANADRLIVDSAQFPPERAAAALAHIERLTRTEDIAVSDLNWARLTAWRELIAQFFDPPAGVGYLTKLERVTAEIASLDEAGEADVTEGLLLVGWLASRLGWTLGGGARTASGNGLALRLDSTDGDSVAVDLEADTDHTGEGLHSLLLRAGDGATFFISRKAGDDACVVVAVEMPDGSGHSRVVHMDMPSEAALLCGELDILDRDSVFEEALAEAVRYAACVS
jgi:glucose-6-phosphate dehydrogenase assembly protein OpcA